MAGRSQETPEEVRMVARSPGRLETLHCSIKRAMAKSPLSPVGRGSKVKVDSSPTGSPKPCSQRTGSIMVSPLRNIGGFFSMKEEEVTLPQQRGGIKRSKTNPNMTALSDSFQRGGILIRRSLRIPNKKEKERGSWEASVHTSKALGEREVEVTKEEEIEEEEEEEALEETYTLNELPTTPLSVMQINKLIELEVLDEAHLNLLSMRQEFQRELEQHSCTDLPVELAKKEKDLSLLYGELRDKICSIVRSSDTLPKDKSILVLVARIVQEEEKRSQEPGGLAGSWMDAWREAVDKHVQSKVESVRLERSQQNVSWLAVHLGLLGKAIVEDLETVRRKLRGLYPPSFRTFSTYVRSYNITVGLHLSRLEQQVTELRDLYNLLKWIIKDYKSENIMGSRALQPDIADESTDLQLDSDFLPHLKDKYCSQIKEDMRSSLQRIINLEDEEFWATRRSPDVEEKLLISSFHMDIWTKVKGNVNNTGLIDDELKQRVVYSCLEELKPFPKRFETQFKGQLQCQENVTLWAKFHVSYINTFAALQDHMEDYHSSCPDQVEGLRREVNSLILRLRQSLENQFKEQVKPLLKTMMTRRWLRTEKDFEQLYAQTQLLAQHCAFMSPLHVQDLVSCLHHHVVQRYIGQVMKSQYSCKNRKHEEAASKIRRQWHKLRSLFEEMNSPLGWLHFVGDHLSDIIGQKKTDIKNHLQPLVENYPDFSQHHLVAVLNFRGLLWGRERQVILNNFAKLKKNHLSAEDRRDQHLFADMTVISNRDWLSRLPVPCLGLFQLVRSRHE